LLNVLTDAGANLGKVVLHLSNGLISSVILRHDDLFRDGGINVLHANLEHLRPINLTELISRDCGIDDILDLVSKGFLVEDEAIERQVELPILVALALTHHFRLALLQAHNTELHVIIAIHLPELPKLAIHLSP